MEEIKRDMIAYWSQRVDEFSAQRCREFQSPKRRLWIEEFQRYFSMDAPLRILDVGTGTGFFANILALEGTTRRHRSDGAHDRRSEAESGTISCAVGVLRHGCGTARVSRRFFDVVISRNLTWALPNLGKAYRRGGAC